MLPNGNIFVGWGYTRDITEFHSNGTVLMHATLHMDEGFNVNNYRNYKVPWVGLPAYPPKLVAYSYKCGQDEMQTPLLAYVSWNGATEIVRWRFLVSEKPGVWIDKGTWGKKDFETKLTLADRFYPHVHVEAIDRYGKVLGSTTADTFVPNITAVGEQCDFNGCFNGTTVDYPPEYSCAEACTKAYNTSYGLGLFVLVIVVEFIGFLYSRVLCREVDLGVMSTRMQKYASLASDNVEKVLPYHSDSSMDSMGGSSNGGPNGRTNDHS